MDADNVFFRLATEKISTFKMILASMSTLDLSRVDFEPAQHNPTPCPPNSMFIEFQPTSGAPVETQVLIINIEVGGVGGARIVVQATCVLL